MEEDDFLVNLVLLYKVGAMERKHGTAFISLMRTSFLTHYRQALYGEQLYTAEWHHLRESNCSFVLHVFECLNTTSNISHAFYFGLMRRLL